MIDTPELAFDPQRLGNLRMPAKAHDPAALRKVAQEFESLLVAQLMKSMRSASFGDKLFESESTKVFTGMLDQQYAQELSRRPGLGLADLIVRQVEQLEHMGVKKTPDTAVKG
jgi:peptidoglycan hydrolase FlgJ